VLGDFIIKKFDKWFGNDWTITYRWNNAT
jgi:hypothetical protein